MKVKVIKESTEQFFTRGRKIARLADEGKVIPNSYIFSIDISSVDEQSSMMTQTADEPHVFCMGFVFW